MNPRTIAGGLGLVAVTLHVLALAIPTSAFANCTTYDNTLHWTATIRGPGWGFGADVSGDHAYVIDLNPSRVWVLDITNPDAPSWMATTDLEGHLGDVEVHGTLLLVAGELGLFVVDITDPSMPRRLSVAPSASTRCVVARGRHAYLGTNSGVVIVDLANPTDPIIVGSFATPGPVRELEFAGDALCVLHSNHGPLVLDVSDPTAPQELGPGVEIPGDARAFSVAGSFAYIAADEKLHVVDITDPKQPLWLRSVDCFTTMRNVICTGTIVLVCGTAGVRTFDVTDPGWPRLIGRFDSDVEFQRAGVGAGRIVVPEPERGVHVLEMGDSRTIPLLGTIPPESESPSYEPHRVATSGPNAFTAGSFGITVLDVATTTPRTIARLPYVGEDLVVDGDRGVVHRVDSLLTLDLSDPSNPRRGLAVSSTYETSVVVRSSCIFMADDAFQVVDISNVDAPRPLARLELPERARLSLEQGLLYVTMASACWVVDISDPASPLVLRKVAGGRPRRLEGDGPIAYAAAGYFGIEVYDATDRAIPALLHTIKTPGTVFDLLVLGGLLFAADAGCGIQILDLSDPSLPRGIGHVETPGTALDLAVAPSGLLVADAEGGLHLVPFACTQTPVTVSEFAVQRGPGVFRFGWYLADSEAIVEQLLQGHAGDMDWNVPVVARGDGAFAAEDAVGFSCDGPVRYDLMALQRSGHWVTLVSREIEASRGAETGVRFSLLPNPARDAVSVSFSSLPNQPVDVAVFGADGRRVATLAVQKFTSGTTRLLWNGMDDRGGRLPSGVYWVRLRIGEQVHSRRFVLVR